MSNVQQQDRVQAFCRSHICCRIRYQLLMLIMLLCIDALIDCWLVWMYMVWYFLDHQVYLRVCVDLLKQIKIDSVWFWADIEFPGSGVCTASLQAHPSLCDGRNWCSSWWVLTLISFMLLTLCLVFIVGDFQQKTANWQTQRIRSNQFPGDIRHDSKTLTEFKTSVTLEMFVISYSMQYSSLPHNHLSRWYREIVLNVLNWWQILRMYQ